MGIHCFLFSSLEGGNVYKKQERATIHACYILVCGRVPWLYQHCPGGFMVLWFYVQEHLKA